MLYDEGMSIEEVIDLAKGTNDPILLINTLITHLKPDFFLGETEIEAEELMTKEGRDLSVLIQEREQILAIGLAEKRKKDLNSTVK